MKTLSTLAVFVFTFYFHIHESLACVCREGHLGPPRNGDEGIPLNTQIAGRLWTGRFTSLEISIEEQLSEFFSLKKEDDSLVDGKIEAWLSPSGDYCEFVFKPYNLLKPNTRYIATLYFEIARGEYTTISFTTGDEIDNMPPTKPAIVKVSEIIQPECCSSCNEGNSPYVEVSYKAAQDECTPQWSLSYRLKIYESSNKNFIVEYIFRVSNEAIPYRIGNFTCMDPKVIFDPSERYCFSMSAIDLAGSESGESDALCTDGTEIDSPSHPEQDAASGCSSVYPGSCEWIIVFLLGIIFLSFRNKKVFC